jgi:hypothetical protein
MQHLLILKYIFPRLAYPEILVNKKGILNVYLKIEEAERTMCVLKNVVVIRSNILCSCSKIKDSTWYQKLEYFN